MKYFGILSLLLVLVIGITWSARGLIGGQFENEAGEIKKPTYQGAIDSAQEAADSISEAGAVHIAVYDGITFPPDTTVVDLSGKNLSGFLRAEIRKLSDLEVLDISRNDFTGLPAEIGQLSKLKILNISHNPLTGLPREIGQLQNLEVLDVTGVQYSAEDMDAIRAQFTGETVIITQ